MISFLARICVGSILTLTLFSGAEAASGVPLFLAMPKSASLAAPNPKIEGVRASTTVRRLDVVKINRVALEAKAISIAIPGGPTLEVGQTQFERHSNSEFTWSGRTAQGGEVVISVNGDRVSGIIEQSRRVFELRSLDVDSHVLVEIDRSKLPPAHVDDVAPSPPASSPGNRRKETISQVPTAGPTAQATTSVPRIDLVVLVTPNAASTLGEVTTMVRAAMTKFNASFSNSQVNLSASLVSTMLLKSEYGADTVSALNALLAMAPAKAVRDSLNADIVVMIGHYTDACGRAPVGAVPATAFAVVSDICLVPEYSMAHEVGHLFGARHDTDPATVPFAYGHGMSYVDAPGHNSECWHDIMAVPLATSHPQQICVADIRINYWSNPNVSYPSAPGGITGAAGCCNTARVLNERARVIESFSDTKLLTPSIVASIVTTILSSDVN